MGLLKSVFAMKAGRSILSRLTGSGGAATGGTRTTGGTRGRGGLLSSLLGGARRRRI